jgi:serine/threonine protein kinase
MYSEPSKLERPSLHLSLDSFHDGEGLPIRGSFDNRLEEPKIVTGDEDEDDPRSSTFASPDLDQKISQRLLGAEQSHNGPGFDFYRPAVPAPFDTGDLSMSPAAMFLSSFSPTSAPTRTPDAEGETVSGYKLGPIIAYGGFSTIRCASSSTGGIVAVKIVRRSDIAQQQDPALARKRLDHEASVWLSLSHEHVLPLFTAVHTSHADFFVTLYCPAGSLFDIMKRDGRPALPHDDAGMMFRQVVRGLRYLHEVARLVHRDIKLENILVDEMGVCRIGDFGMSMNIGELDVDDEDLLEMQMMQQDEDENRTHSQGGGERRTTFAQAKRQTKPGLPVHLSMIRHHSGPRHRNSTPANNTGAPARPAQVFQTGSLPYAAPELLMPHFSTPARVDPAQDVWALGVMLYAMLTGRLPFVDTFDPRLQMKILHGKFSTFPFSNWD